MVYKDIGMMDKVKVGVYKGRMERRGNSREEKRRKAFGFSQAIISAVTDFGPVWANSRTWIGTPSQLPISKWPNACWKSSEFAIVRYCQLDVSIHVLLYTCRIISLYMTVD